MDSVTSNRLQAIWGAAPRSLEERTVVNQDGSAMVTCDPVNVLIAGVNGTLIRLTDVGAE